LLLHGFVIPDPDLGFKDQKPKKGHSLYRYSLKFFFAKNEKYVIWTTMKDLKASCEASSALNIWYHTILQSKHAYFSPFSEARAMICGNGFRPFSLFK
jgi:hypothetical protein